MREVECPNCGAVFDAEESKCPYCLYINPEGAEAKYLSDLESRRRELGAVDDQVKSEYRKEARKGAGSALRVILITVLIIAVVAGGFVFAENRMFRSDGYDYAAELAWEHEHFPEYDRLLDAGSYEELIAALAEDGEEHEVWNWERYDEFMDIADKLWGNEP